MPDVYMTPTGDYEYPTRYIAQDRASIQRARLRVLQHRGEWLLDTRTGAPWIAWLDTKPFPKQQIEEFFRADLASIPDIDTVVATAEVDNVTGDATVTIALRFADATLNTTLRIAPGATDPAARVAVI
jgi:hypothetical protein